MTENKVTKPLDSSKAISSQPPSNASPCPVSAVGTDASFGPHSTTGMFITKDSGKRQSWDSGMVRDTNEGKTDFTYLVMPGVPYEDQPLHRLMGLYMRGAEKYSRDNWTKANSPEELQRFKESAFRHWMMYLSGDREEDHLAAFIWNGFCIMYLEQKLELLKEDLTQ